MSLLQTHNLAIGYGSTILLEELNLTIDSGKLIGLIGQNGVGKSTLLRTLSGFQPTLNGTIEISGQNIQEYSPIERAKLFSVVLTEKPSNQNLDVLELVSFGRHPYSGWLGKLTKDDIQAIEQALEHCQIHHLLKKKFYELSDGQKQKVMIARALTQDTPLILLDEPTSHLDLRNKVDVLEVLKSITIAGKSCLITTHEISLAIKVCDEFWGMDFDKPIEIGNPKKMLESGKVEKILHLSKGVIW